MRGQGCKRGAQRAEAEANARTKRTQRALADAARVKRMRASQADAEALKAQQAGAEATAFGCRRNEKNSYVKRCCKSSNAVLPTRETPRRSSST